MTAMELASRFIMSYNCALSNELSGVHCARRHLACSDERPTADYLIPSASGKGIADLRPGKTLSKVFLN